MRKGWTLKVLGDVCTLQRGFDLPTRLRKHGTFPLVSSNGITDWIEEWKVKGPGVTTGRSGSIGTIHYIEEDFWPLNTALFIKDFHGNDPRFIYYLLGNFNLSKFAGGAGVPTLNRNTVHSENVSIPSSISEQKQIVCILDQAFATIDKAIENTKKNLQNAKELFESYLQEVLEHVGDRNETSIAEVCEEIFAGGDAPKENFSLEKNKSNTVPIYANAVKDRGLYGYTNFARVTAPSITISARGSGTGHTELRNESYLPIVRLIVLIPKTEIVKLEFLKFKIDNLEILRSGSAIPQLTVPMIKEYKIHLPSIKEQIIIVDKLNNLQTETKKLETIYEQKIADLEELKKSILQKAFNGELITEPIPELV